MSVDDPLSLASLILSSLIAILGIGVSIYFECSSRKRDKTVNEMDKLIKDLRVGLDNRDKTIAELRASLTNSENALAEAQSNLKLHIETFQKYLGDRTSTLDQETHQKEETEAAFRSTLALDPFA